MNKADALFKSLTTVRDEATFLAFVEALQADAKVLGPDWNNKDIPSFLEAAVAWAKDSDFGSRPGPRPSNIWRLCAAFLWAGRGYE